MSPYEVVLKTAMSYSKTNFPGCKIHFALDTELAPGIIVHPKKFSATLRASKYRLNTGVVGKPVATIAGWKIYEKIIEYDLRNIGYWKSKFNYSVDLICWTIDDPKQMEWLIKKGVNGILTNKPGLLSKIYKELSKNK